MTTPPILPGLEKGSTNEELTNMAMVVSMFMPKSAQNLGAMRSLFLMFLSYNSVALEICLRVSLRECEYNLFLLRKFISLDISARHYRIRLPNTSSNWGNPANRVPVVRQPTGTHRSMPLRTQGKLATHAYHRRKNRFGGVVRRH